MIDRNIKREIMLDNYQNPFNKYVPNDKSYIKVNTNNESCIEYGGGGHMLAAGASVSSWNVVDNIIKDITFFGEACAISTSATSIMNRLLIGKTKEEVLNILDNYENMINEKEYNKDILKDLNVYEEIYLQPNRKTCALLPTKAIRKVLENM